MAFIEMLSPLEEDLRALPRVEEIWLKKERKEKCIFVPNSHVHHCRRG